LNEENRLWSPANNQGLKNCAEDSKYCLLLNSDVQILDPAWLSELQKPMNKFQRVAITGTQYNFNHVKPTYGGIDGCCFMFRKELLDEIGLLDENYPLNGAGYVYTVNAWAKGWYYYFVDNDKLLIHFGKRSRIDKQTQLRNVRVNRFQVIKDAGLKPGNNYFAYFLNRLNLFNINKKLRRYYS
jgi:GT2 family glycosyltransferase